MNISPRRWRATPESLTVYECTLDRSCRGGRSTAASEQCFDGHVGALCGACDDGYDFDLARNRCAKCSSAHEMMARVGNLFLLFALIAALVLFIYARYRERMRGLWQNTVSFMNEGRDATEQHEESKGENESDQSEAEVEARSRRKFRKSLFNKAKIIISTWQIAASTETVRPLFFSVNNPDLTLPGTVGPLASSLSAGLCENHAALQRSWPRESQCQKLSTPRASDSCPS